MTKKIFLKFFCILSTILCLFSIASFCVYADEEETDTPAYVTPNKACIFKAIVEDGYPEQYVDMVLKNNTEKTEQTIRFHDLEMYQKVISLYPGDYTLTCPNPVDSENYPVESMSFTITDYGQSIYFKVGRFEEYQTEETTTEKSIDVVEKETTTEKITEEETTSSIVKIEEKEKESFWNKLSKMGTVTVIIALSIFTLITVAAIVLFLYIRKRNKTF